MSLVLSIALLIAAPVDDVEARIQAAITKLGNQAFRVRDQGQRELLEIGAPALPALKVATASNDPEVVKRATTIMETIRAREQAASGIHVVGLYEGNNNQANVIVSKGEFPITLVLCAYEPVTWNVKVEPGAVITKVILSGYHKQKVVGVDAPTTSSSYEEGNQNYFFAYERDAENYPQLVKRVRAITGKEIASFQGAYNPKDMVFTIR